MKTENRHKLYMAVVLILFIALIGAPSVIAQAKDYPNRPINMIVPFAPGGAADLGSKTVANHMREFLGQPLISIYKPGGSGTLGASFVAKAKPDGYTLLVESLTPNVMSPLVRKIDYTLDDFIPIGVYGKGPVWLVVKADAKWKDLKEYIAEAKKSPGALTIGSYGMLSVAHFLIERFCKQANIQLTHVPFKSSGTALTSLLGRHVDSAFIMGSGGGHLQAGNIRVLAAAVDERLEGLPDIPTFIDYGYSLVSNQWTSIAAPKGTPKEIIDILSSAQKKAFEKSDALKKDMRKIDFWAQHFSPEESIRLLKEEQKWMREIAKDLGVLVK